MHIPVLQAEILELFRPHTIHCFVDATVGMAGHTKQILKKHPEIEQFFGFDQDSEALKRAEKALENVACTVHLIHKNFEHIKEVLSAYELFSVDAILFDIGVSSLQLDTKERGFSFLQEGPLDMRMDTREAYTAEDAINDLPEKKLADIFFLFGEEYRSRKIARMIVQKRAKKRITTTKELADIVAIATPRRGKVHPATKVFQALRIYVNRELEVLEKALTQALSLIAPGGLVAVISFHSLEDRIVKQLFRKKAKEDPAYQIVTKKPITASIEEKKDNPRARSAKLRCIRKV